MGSKPLILLDTHVLVWLDQDSPSISEAAYAIVDEALAAGDLAVSAIAFWEVATLLRKRRLRLDLNASAWRDAFLTRGLEELPVTGAIGIAAVELDDFDADPADRIIVATARAHNATLLTADEKILAWPGRLDRRDARL